MKKRPILLSGVFVIVLFACSIGIAETLPLITLDFPPWNYRDKNTGEITGASVEIVTELFRRMGYEVRIDMKPWKRGQVEAARGEYAGIFTFTKSAEREEIYYYAEPMSTITEVFFKRKDRTIVWNTLEDLKGLTVGGVHGYNNCDPFKKAVKAGYLKFETLSSATADYQNLLKLKARRIDLFISDVTAGCFIIREHPGEFDDIGYIDKPIEGIVFMYFAIPKKWPGASDLIGKFNAELKKYILEGKLDEMHKKYGIVTFFEKGHDGKVTGFQDFYKYSK